jgi:hypothetical protein
MPIRPLEEKAISAAAEKDRQKLEAVKEELATIHKRVDAAEKMVDDALEELGLPPRKLEPDPYWHS